MGSTPYLSGQNWRIDRDGSGSTFFGVTIFRRDNATVCLMTQGHMTPMKIGDRGLRGLTAILEAAHTAGRIHEIAEVRVHPLVAGCLYIENAITIDMLQAVEETSTRIIIKSKLGDVECHLVIVKPEGAVGGVDKITGLYDKTGVRIFV